MTVTTNSPSCNRRWGYIDVVHLEKGIIAVRNEEGKGLGLKPSVAWMQNGRARDVLVGNVLVMRTEGAEMVSLMESDLPTVKRHLVPVN